MLTVACCLWDANEHTNPACGSYDEAWVERLYRGYRRNLTLPFRFVVFTDRDREFCAGIEQERLATATPHYGCLIEPFRLDAPMILTGLDTVIVGNIDHMAQWCMTGDKVALPRDPRSYSRKHEGYPDQSINAVALVPAGWRRIHDEWDGENDMVHLRKYPWECIDDRWPGQVVSYRLRVRADMEDPKDARIVYFHGSLKPHDLDNVAWVKEHWR